jgi:hypothetical protein
MNIAPTIMRAAKLVLEHITENDYLFSVTANNKDWDVYRVILSDISGQIAFTMEGDNVVVGWLGPGQQSEEEIIKQLNIGMPLEIPDA